MKLTAIFLFLPLFLFCQSERFVYEYTSVKDTVKNDTVKAVMYLEVYKTGSVFYDIRNYRNDSVAYAQGDRLSQFENRVYKKYPGYEVALITPIHHEVYSVSDPRKMDWKISPEKKEINTLTGQKATLDFGGRVWTAWFSTDIPIADGPYKFHGLPGLIIQMEDRTRTHRFELVAVEKAGGVLDNRAPHHKVLAVDHNRYRKLYKEYRENPAKDISGTDILETQDGKTGAEFKRNMEKYYKNRIRRDHNILEIDLLKPDQ